LCAVLAVLMLLLKLVLLTLFRTCGYEGVLFGEYTNHTSSDFMMNNRFVAFPYDIDPEMQGA
jgi:hypothetical protein